MEQRLEYDVTNPQSIEDYASWLVGKSFLDVCKRDAALRMSYVEEELAGYAQSHENKKRKGGLGELIEERFFHYAANNDAHADFPEAGVELKVTPYKINKNGSVVAKERLILTMIDYFGVPKETFEDSHMWQKAQLILLVYYLYQKEVESRLDYKIGYVKLFSPPKEDVKIIKEDFYKIQAKIKAGKAHELSEGDTLYLGAAPKASNSKDRRKQPYSEELAKPRAFAFKGSYMTYVLNNYIIPGKKTYEPIVKGTIEVPFELYVVQKINKYCGYTVDALCREFNVDQATKKKNLEAILAYRILGISGNHAEEFEKASIVVKTIRIGLNGKIKEHMSFPTFKFKELVKENWETSTFGNYLRETRFLFVVYKYETNNVLCLKGCQFWNIPYNDLEIEVRSVWEKTVYVLQNGLVITRKGARVINNFPKSSENKVAHVRPHARNAQDTYELPDGRMYTKQCFWLNNDYILSQLEERLK